MKYEFTGKGDTVTLKYKDKTFEFKTNIKIISELQGLTADSRLMMLEDLSKKGISIRDYSVEREENGKKIIDNSNREELEAIYEQKCSELFFDKKCRELFNMGTEELYTDIGLMNEEEGMKFAMDFIMYMSGNFPSDKEVPENKQKK